MHNPENDGITHINVYSKGKTELGRLLTNFAHTPFTFEPYGTFQSVEAFWYYYLTGCQHESLRHLYGSQAKKAGQSVRDDRIDKTTGLTPHQKETILEAIRCKLRQNKEVLTLLRESTLPFTHYYAFGTFEAGYRIKDLPEYQWIIDELSRLRDICHAHDAAKHHGPQPT